MRTKMKNSKLAFWARRDAMPTRPYISLGAPLMVLREIDRLVEVRFLAHKETDLVSPGDLTFSFPRTKDLVR